MNKNSLLMISGKRTAYLSGLASRDAVKNTITSKKYMYRAHGVPGTTTI